MKRIRDVDKMIEPHTVSGQNDPKRAKSWTIRFNCPIQMGFIPISRSFSPGRGLRQTIIIYCIILS